MSSDQETPLTIVADYVPVALIRVELDSEATDISDGILG